MKLAEKLSKKLVEKEAVGSLKVWHAGKDVRGKQWWVSVYDKDDGWIAVPELESDSEKEAQKKAKAYAKKHKLGKIISESLDRKKAKAMIQDADYSEMADILELLDDELEDARQEASEEGWMAESKELKKALDMNKALIKQLNLVHKKAGH